MTWFRVDDSFADHPKVIALQASRHWKGALSLWLLAGAWCAKHERDGAIPTQVAQRLGGTRAEIDALVQSGLWSKTDDGYQFHDWEQCNPTRAELDSKREKTKEKLSKWRARNQVTDLVTNPSQQPVTDPPVTLPPSLPVPTHPIPSNTQNAGVRVEPLIAEEPGPTTAQRIRAAWDARILAATAAPAAWPHKAGEHVRVLAEWIDRLNPPDVDAAIAQLLDAYFREPWARQKAFPLSALAGNPSRYWNAAEGRLEALRRKADEIKAQRGICDEWRAAMDEWIAARKRLARDTEVSNGSN